jgi:hypothetical protein
MQYALIGGRSLSQLKCANRLTALRLESMPLVSDGALPFSCIDCVRVGRA